MPEPMTLAQARELDKIAVRMRQDICKMLCLAGSGHPGGSLSAADIMTYLYFHKLRVDSTDPAWPQRDRFVLSKGHAAPVLYAALAHKGFFDRELLWTLRKLGSILQGHPDMKQVPGVEMSTGALGHGLAGACGMALASRLSGLNYQTFALLGDGECQEGVIWEAAMFAAHYNLDSLTAIIDFNGLQIDGRVSEVMNIDPIVDKWEAFGWEVREADGHDILDLDKAMNGDKGVNDKPLMVIARTVKGKGVSFMEHVVDYHGKAPTAEEARLAEIELEQYYCEIDNDEVDVND